MHFWSNVQKLMTARKLTAKALAERAGVTAPALTSYSKGTTPRLDIAVRIAEVLGASMDELVWGQDGLASRPLCPSVEEHTLLHELTEELGMKEFIALTRLGNQAAAWKVADVLVSQFPRALRLEELQAGLPGMSESLLKTSLLSLRRRGLVDESQQDGVYSYALHTPLTAFSAQEMGDLTQHIKRAVKILLQHVLPAIERPDRTGHLVTFQARLPEEKAVALAHHLNRVVKREIEQYVGPDEGDTGIFVSFGVAFRKQEC